VIDRAITLTRLLATAKTGVSTAQVHE